MDLVLDTVGRRMRWLAIGLLVTVFSFAAVSAFGLGVGAQNGPEVLCVSVSGEFATDECDDEFAQLSVALDAVSENPTEIWVGAGSFTPSISGLVNVRDATFEIPDGVTVYGGFPAEGGSFDQRSPSQHTTTLSGFIGNPENNSDNSFTVVTVGQDVIASLDGVTITGGNASALVANPVEIGSGGGIYVTGTVNLTGVRIIENHAYRNGAGLYVDTAGFASIHRSLIAYNETQEGVGGGVYVDGGEALITSSTIAGNVTDVDGGGMFIASGTVDILHSTIRDNDADSDGGGLFIGSAAIVDIFGSIVAGNTAGDGPDISGTVSAGSFNLIGDEEDMNGIEDGQNGNQVGINPHLGSLQDNGGPSETMMPGAVSPAINAIPSSDCATPGIETDQRGVPRGQGPDGECTVGAVEVVQGQVYVNDTAIDGLNNGSSWEDAFLNLQFGLAEARSAPDDVDIFVAGGTYYPVDPEDPENVTVTERNARFEIPDGVSLYGGFAGDEQAPLDVLVQRDLASNATVLSGNIDRAPEISGEIDSSNNSYTVVTINADVEAAIDGVTITGGNANGTGATITFSGGGIWVFSGADVTIVNSTITGNTASSSGGGVYVAGNGDATIVYSTISGNTSSASGPAQGGGGVYVAGNGDATIVNSTISGNTSSAAGGGVNVSNDSTAAIINSTIRGNRAQSDFAGGGGGIFSGVSGSVDIANSTVSGNATGDRGGGVSLGSSGPHTIANSILWGNSATFGANNLQGTSNVTVSHVIIGGGCVGAFTECSMADPLFVELIDPSEAPTSDGNYRLLPGSPAIDRGDNDAYDDAISALPQHVQDLIDETRDLDGNDRVVGPSIDRGAYEAQFTDAALSMSVNTTSATIGDQITIDVQITVDGSSTNLVDGQHVTLSGHGGDQQIELDDQGQGSISFTAGFLGSHTLSATFGTLSDTAKLTIQAPALPQPPVDDDDVDDSVDDGDPPPAGPQLHTMPDHLIVSAMTPAGAIVEYVLPTATDPVDGDLDVSCTPPPGSWMPVGHTTVTCSATNSAGETASASFGVSVQAYQATDFDQLDEIDNPWFFRTWARTDLPVRDGHIARTWMWAPGAFTGSLWEPYTTELQNPGGDPVLLSIPDDEREVIYFDKARMEINDPEADPDDLWFVTNGLLVIEMITGNRQFGDDLFIAYEPSHSNVAGDADDLNGPTYAALQNVLDEPAQSVGTLLTQEIDRYGAVTTDAAWGDYSVQVAFVDEVTGQGIAGPFWEFMQSEGLVYEDGELNTDALFENPFYATGRPITEAYWANVKVAGEQRDVLLQCFERRCLTYTPGNDDGFVVEAGNVGQHYYHWRYVQAPD
jgi:hypothetical protein